MSFDLSILVVLWIRINRLPRLHEPPIRPRFREHHEPEYVVEHLYGLMPRVVPDAELVQIVLEMLLRDPTVRPLEPRLQVSEDPMHSGELLRCVLGLLEDVPPMDVSEFFDAPIAPPSVRPHD